MKFFKKLVVFLLVLSLSLSLCLTAFAGGTDDDEEEVGSSDIDEDVGEPDDDEAGKTDDDEEEAQQPGDDDEEEAKPGDDDEEEAKPGDDDEEEAKPGDDDEEEQKPGDDDEEEKPGDDDEEEEKPGDDDPDKKDVREIFTDLADYKDDYYATAAIQFCYDNGLMIGVAPDKFAPKATTTRAEVATIICRMRNGEPGTSTRFSDVAAGEWYTPYIAWADGAKIMIGISATQFAPNAAITREQLVTALWRVSGSPKSEASLKDFSDAEKVSSYAETAMAWAVENHVVLGTDIKTLEPGATATREEMAAIFMRFITNG